MNFTFVTVYHEIGLILKQTFNYRHVLTEFPLRYHLLRLFLIYFRKLAVNDQSSIRHQVDVQRNWNVVTMLSLNINVSAPAWSSSPLIHITINVDVYFVFVFVFTIIQQWNREIKELTTLTLVINIKIAQHLAVLFTIHYTIFKLFFPLIPSTDPVTRKKNWRIELLLNFLFPIRTVFQLILSELMWRSWNFSVKIQIRKSIFMLQILKKFPEQRAAN